MKTRIKVGKIYWANLVQSFNDRPNALDLHQVRVEGKDPLIPRRWVCTVVDTGEQVLLHSGRLREDKDTPVVSMVPMSPLGRTTSVSVALPYTVAPQLKAVPGWQEKTRQFWIELASAHSVDQ